MANETAPKSPGKSEKRKNAWKSLPDVWALIKPRRGLLAAGFVLMAINRVAGLVLPVSTKYFVDNVVLHRQVQLLTPIVLGVLGATIVQGLTSAVIALVYLLHTSVEMTVVAFSILLVFGFGISRAFKTIRPIFRARPKITAEVTGRLTESLGGVRVVKGYHAEEREEKIFASGVQRLLDNVLKTLTATSLMSLSGSMLLGVVSVLMLEFGGHKMLAGTLTPGQWFAYNA